MTDRSSDLSSPSRAPRSLLAARKFALMASVVAGLGVAGYGLSPAPHDVFTSAAHAQVDKQVKQQAAQPTGFADIVER
jgi:serine protease Do